MILRRIDTETGVRPHYVGIIHDEVDEAAIRADFSGEWD